MTTSTAPVRARCDWQVETLTRATGVASVQPVGQGLLVTVADLPATGGADTTQAWLCPDGRATVRTHAAPPALLVSSTGARLLPAVPGMPGVAGEDDADLLDDDILVMCSAAALQELPAGLGAILEWSPRRLGAQDPAALLRRLMAGSEVGAAVVARCRLSSPDAGG